MKMNTRCIAALAMMAPCLLHQSPEAGACTRVLYEGDGDLYVVGRSLDWKTPIPTNVYIYPAGMAKQGNVQENSVKWVSKYGAVYAVGYDAGITEGMNEKGLTVNGLFCKGTVYSNPQTADRSPMSLAVFVAWMLDNFATTDECVAALQKHDFDISGATFDGGTVSTLHWGITDAGGNTAILEFDNGDIKIYQGKDIRTLTNDPQWPAMQAINDYWKKVKGKDMLPGTVKSPDRFVRADYYIRHVEKTADPDLAVSITESVLRTACVPYSYTVEDEPNVSSTQWISFANIRDRRYYFHPITSLGLYYVDLNKCNLKPGAPVMKLEVASVARCTGEINSHLKKSEPFQPMY